MATLGDAAQESRCTKRCETFRQSVPKFDKRVQLRKCSRTLDTLEVRSSDSRPPGFRFCERWESSLTLDVKPHTRLHPQSLGDRGLAMPMDLPCPDRITSLRFRDLAAMTSNRRSAQHRQAVAVVDPRPWLAVHWRCCNAYSRIYRNRAGTAYTGQCPRCSKLVSANIGPGGTTARFFMTK